MRCAVPWLPQLLLLLLLHGAALLRTALASHEQQCREVTPATASCSRRTGNDALADWVSALQTGLQLHALPANGPAAEQQRLQEGLATQQKKVAPRVSLAEMYLKVRSASKAVLRRAEPGESWTVAIILFVVVGAPLGMALIFLMFLTEEPKKRVPVYVPPPSVSSSSGSMPVVPVQRGRPVFHDKPLAASSGAGAGLLGSSLPGPAFPSESYSYFTGGLGNLGSGALNVLQAGTAGTLSLGSQALDGMGSLGRSSLEGTAQLGGSLVEGVEGIVKEVEGAMDLDLNASRAAGLLEPMAVVRDRMGMHVRMIGCPEPWQQEVLLDIVRDDGQVILRVLISENVQDSEILLQSVTQIPMAYMNTKNCTRPKHAGKIPVDERYALIYDVPPYLHDGEDQEVFATARPLGSSTNVIAIRRGFALDGPVWYQVRKAAGTRANITDAYGRLIATVELSRAAAHSHSRPNYVFFISGGTDAAMVIMAYVAAQKCS